MSKFKLNDDVFHPAYGWGKVINTEICTVGGIMVQFEEWRFSFRNDGRTNDQCFSPILFTKEEAASKFPEYPLPKRKKKVKVYVAVCMRTDSNKKFQTSLAYSEKEKCTNQFHNQQIIEGEIEVDE